MEPVDDEFEFGPDPEPVAQENLKTIYDNKDRLSKMGRSVYGPQKLHKKRNNTYQGNKK